MSDAPMRWVKPKSGLVVRDPFKGDPLPAHGAGVLWSSYWQRRLDDGDLIETDQKSIEAGERKALEASIAADIKPGDAK